MCMEKRRTLDKNASVEAFHRDLIEQPWEFLRTAVGLAQRDLPFGDFLQSICPALSDRSGCKHTVIWTKDHGKEVGCACTVGASGEVEPVLMYGTDLSAPRGKDLLEWYKELKKAGGATPWASLIGTDALLINPGLVSDETLPWQLEKLRDCGLLILLPFGADAGGGLVVLGSRRPDRPDSFTLSRLELLVESFGIALEIKRTQLALAERIKELTCLYKMALLAEEPGTSIDELLQGVADLLPDACLYPREASARIELDGLRYEHGSQEIVGEPLEAEITVLGASRGTVRLAYGQRKPQLDYGPFLAEEKNLLETVAREIALLVERKQREAENRALEEQLRHADRLATIGELAAGVAHELNEPLANILGFAQLAEKTPRLPRQAREDLGKIVQAALHARGLTQQLLLFARRMPQNRARIDLNSVVAEALSLLEPLFAKGQIELRTPLSPHPVWINADISQIRQVVVNLTVNAVQAMPNGGRLEIRTSTEPEQGTAILLMEDTGVGMSEATLGKIFLPFFTTKEAGRGTGLGLAVVHGIVTSHGGRIEVRSKENVGTCFSVFLPLAKNEAE